MINLIKKNLLFKLLILSIFVFGIYYYFPYRVEFLGHYDKVLAHRCNSVDRLNAALNYYKGVELDLVYYPKTNVLDVNHPPSESTNLNFTTYMNGLISKEQPFIWLDIKNLNVDNASLIFEKITAILSAKNYKLNKVLIETRHPEALPIFTEAGFKTCYYLPKRLYLKSPNELKKYISRITKVLKKQPRIGISTDFQDYDIMNEYFPEREKYTWVLVFPINKHLLITKRILNDPMVKIVLTKYNSLLHPRI